MLAGYLGGFVYLKPALAAILVFVGLKMAFLNDLFGGKFPIPWSLGIIGMLLVCSGVIGLWGIGFFTPELIRTVLTKTYAAQGMAHTTS